MAEVRVHQLEPGDQVTMDGPMGLVPGPATVVATTAHPVYPGLMLVIWAFTGGHPLNIKTSFDALSPMQVVGEGDDPDTDTRKQRLADAMKLLNGEN